MANEKQFRDPTKMIRLIDADALSNRFEEMAYKCKYIADMVFHLDLILDEIMDAPTVEAVEVVHGHWFSLTDCSNAGVYCSVCHKKVWREDYAWCNRKNKLRSNYCPNCGAKMDLKGVIEE